MHHHIFQNVVGIILNTLLRSTLSIAYNWRKMELTISYLLSYDCLEYYILSNWWLRSLARFNQINITYMTISIKKITYIIFMVIALIIITLFARFYVRIDILLTCWNHYHDCMTSLKRDICSLRSSLTLNRARNVIGNKFVCQNWYRYYLFLWFCY